MKSFEKFKITSHPPEEKQEKGTKKIQEKKTELPEISEVLPQLPELPKNVKEILRQEKTIFGQIHGKAKRVARVMLLMTLLSANVPAFSQKTYAQEQTQQPVKQEQIQQEQDKLIWSSQPERPKWIYQEPRDDQEYYYFVGESEKYAIEKGATDAAYRDAISKTGKFMEPVKHAQIKECYVEQKREITSGKTYWKAFVLLEIPKNMNPKKDFSSKEIRNLDKEKNRLKGNTVDVELSQSQEIKKSYKNPSKLQPKKVFSQPPVIKQKQEVQKEQKNKINEAKLTASSAWARDIIKNTYIDLKKIKTTKDAEWFIRSYINQFVSEYYLPTKGNLKEGVYGIKIREYSQDDIKLLLKITKEMKQILENLNKKYNINTYNKYQDQINNIIENLELQSSFSFQKQKEILDQVDKIFQ